MVLQIPSLRWFGCAELLAPLTFVLQATPFTCKTPPAEL